MLTANISEIFSSIQGEGPYTGEKTTFVRFAGCTMNCRFCDTPHALLPADTFRVEGPAGSMEFEEIENPVGAGALSGILEKFEDEMISVTGGEPLEQVDFLENFLPAFVGRRKILLETNGVRYGALQKILPHVNVISMDFKLPSSAGSAPKWEEHGIFLKIAVSSGRQTYVKIVVTGETTDRDIQKAIVIIARVNKFIPVIIQPAAPTLMFRDGATEERIQSIGRIFGAYLPSVRIMSQMHKEWGVL